MARSTNASVQHHLFHEPDALDDADQIPSGSLAWSGRPAPSRRSTAMAVIDRAERGGRHPHGVDPADRGDQQAAQAGADDVGQVELPRRRCWRGRVSSRPGGRLGQHRFAGRHAGGSNSAPNAASTASTVTVMASVPNISAMTGTAATESAESRSEIIETRRRPR